MYFRLFLLSTLFFFISSCSYVTDKSSQNIARYGESFLSNEDFLSQMQGFEKEDSLLRANTVINNWAIEKILIERAKLNLDENKIQNIESLVAEYRSNMLSEAYIEALVNSSIDLEVDSIEIQSLYENNKGLFVLNDDIFKLVYIELPLDFYDTYLVRSKIKRFKRDDQNFLDSISFRFKGFSLNKDKWIAKNELLQKFPFFTNYSYRSLKNYNFFQFKDSLSLYLIKVTESANNGDISPMDYVLPTLEYMSLNKRKKDLIQKIKTDILSDALSNNKLEIY